MLVVRLILGCEQIDIACSGNRNIMIGFNLCRLNIDITRCIETDVILGFNFRTVAICFANM